MTRIVAVLTDPATVHICLDAAAVAAAAVPGGEVEAFHARLKPESMILPTEEVMTPTRRAHLVALLDKKTQEIRGAVREWVTAHQRENGPVWNEAEGNTVEAIVAARGKAADLVVLVRPAEHEGKEALHAAIFDTGRLLLLMPPSPAARSFGRHIAIAWKASDQATRAVTATVPWLKHAERVSLLMIDREGEPPPSPDDAVGLLDPHGIAIEPVPLTQGKESVGAQLLREAHALGADCLVMGAYRHHRLLEMILGGVTRHMLQEADMPLFLMH
jgi:nucleotide-binding universal stress UspA family protein